MAGWQARATRRPVEFLAGEKENSPRCEKDTNVMNEQSSTRAAAAATAHSGEATMSDRSDRSDYGETEHLAALAAWLAGWREGRTREGGRAAPGHDPARAGDRRRRRSQINWTRGSS